MMSPARQRERFEEWLRDHARILHHTVNGFATGDDCGDLMQELLLALWKAIPAYREESRVSTFLYRVAHNAALTWRRKRKAYDRKMGEYRLQSPGGQEEDGDASAAVSARLELLYAEIRRLPALDRSLMLLSLDGMAYSEMAAIHGLSESNVGVRLNRARQKLTQSLKNTK